MATKKPLVLTNGELSEIQSGDKIPTSTLNTVSVSTGVSDAGKIPVLNSSGVIDASMVTGGGGGSQEIFIQNNTPSTSGPALWLQTGLGNGNGFTLWAIS